MSRSRGLAEAAIAELQQERAETLRALLDLTDDDCRRPVQQAGRQQSVNQVLRAFTSHVLDHHQHLVRLLQARGRRFSEAELLLAKANAAMAELEVAFLALPDDEFLATGPVDGDWSAKQVLDHVIGNERKYRGNIVTGLRSPAEPGPAEG